MTINFDSRNFSQQDCDIVANNLNEIIELGIKAYKRSKKKTGELTNREKVLFNILDENNKKYMSKQELVDKYNYEIFGNYISKYMKTQNITTKINRLNRKLKRMQNYK